MLGVATVVSLLEGPASVVCRPVSSTAPAFGEGAASFDGADLEDHLIVGMKKPALWRAVVIARLPLNVCVCEPADVASDSSGTGRMFPVYCLGLRLQLRHRRRLLECHGEPMDHQVAWLRWGGMVLRLRILGQPV